MTSTPIPTQNTVLRGSHQSLVPMRLSAARILPVAAMFDWAGYAGVKMRRGATMDACLRFLGENPLDRLRALGRAARRPAASGFRPMISVP